MTSKNIDIEEKKYPHEFIPMDLGHSQTMCKHCNGTPNEIQAIGDMNHCEDREKIPLEQ